MLNPSNKKKKSNTSQFNINDKPKSDKLTLFLYIMFMYNCVYRYKTKQYYCDCAKISKLFKLSLLLAFKNI